MPATGCSGNIEHLRTFWGLRKVQGWGKPFIVHQRMQNKTGGRETKSQQICGLDVQYQDPPCSLRQGYIWPQMMGI